MRMDVTNIESLATFSSEKYVKVPLGHTKGLGRLLCFEPRQEVPLHMHPEADEVFYVVKGVAVFAVGEEPMQEHVTAGKMARGISSYFQCWCRFQVILLPSRRRRWNLFRCYPKDIKTDCLNL